MNSVKVILCTVLIIKTTCIQVEIYQGKLIKGRFTQYDFVACDKLTTDLRHELFCVNQTYNSLMTVVYNANGYMKDHLFELRRKI